MELDEMKLAWQQMNAKLDALQAADDNLLVEVQKDRALRSMWRTSALIWFETASNGLVLVLLGIFIMDQRTWLFIVPALILYPAAIAMFASSVLQLRWLTQVDFGESVIVIQQKLERLYALRLRVAKVTVLLVCLLWVPLAIVLARGLWGGDLYAAGTIWLVANVVLGIVAIPVLWSLAHCLGKAFNQSRWGRFLLDDLAGHGLAQARRRMAAIADFASEPG